VSVRVRRTRSWIFAPGHKSDLLNKVFDTGADEVLLDLEDAVPAALKDQARQLVMKAAKQRPCWVRVNRPFTEACVRDLDALAGLVKGFRIPKVESAEDIEWVATRSPGVSLDCTVETARGVISALEIASSPGCTLLSYGGVDLSRDLGIAGGELETLVARSTVVLAARAAGKPAPSDGVHVRLNDDEGLREESEAARRIGFFGKSAIHPRQVPIINEVFSPRPSEVEWANRVLDAFAASGEAATKLADGEFVDEAVAARARQIIGDLDLDAGTGRR
jgi:citrate lyase subunit beta/citryl-CoA lyase